MRVMGPANRKVTTPPALPGGLTAVELAACGLLVKQAKTWRDQLDAGPDQPVDVLLRLDGSVSVALDQQYVATTKPDFETLLGRVFELLGSKTGAKLATQLVDEPGLEPSLAARAVARDVIERLTSQQTKTKSGNVTGQIHVTRLPAP
jgi:hypothetical protein